MQSRSRAASKWLAQHLLDPNDPRNAVLLELLRAREAAAHSSVAAAAAGASDVFRYEWYGRWLTGGLCPGLGTDHVCARVAGAVYCPCFSIQLGVRTASLCGILHIGYVPYIGRLCCVFRLDISNEISMAVDRAAGQRAAFIRQRWLAGPLRSAGAGGAKL